MELGCSAKFSINAGNRWCVACPLVEGAKLPLAEILKFGYIDQRMKLTTNQIAERVNLTANRISQLLRSGIIEGEKIGRDWLIDEDQIAVINNLPDNRGKFRWKYRHHPTSRQQTSL